MSQRLKTIFEYQTQAKARAPYPSLKKQPVAKLRPADQNYQDFINPAAPFSTLLTLNQTTPRSLRRAFGLHGLFQFRKVDNVTVNRNHPINSQIIFFDVLE